MDPLLGSAIIGGVGSIASGIIGGDSSKKAAKAAAKAADAAKDLQYDQFATTRADYGPWRYVGANALRQIAAELGLPDMGPLFYDAMTGAVGPTGSEAQFPLPPGIDEMPVWAGLVSGGYDQTVQNLRNAGWAQDETGNWRSPSGDTNITDDYLRQFADARASQPGGRGGVTGSAQRPRAPAIPAGVSDRGFFDRLQAGSLQEFQSGLENAGFIRQADGTFTSRSGDTTLTPDWQQQYVASRAPAPPAQQQAPSNALPQPAGTPAQPQNALQQPVQAPPQAQPLAGSQRYAPGSTFAPAYDRIIRQQLADANRLPDPNSFGAPRYTELQNRLVDSALTPSDPNAVAPRYSELQQNMLDRGMGPVQQSGRFNQVQDDLLSANDGTVRQTAGYNQEQRRLLDMARDPVQQSARFNQQQRNLLDTFDGTADLNANAPQYTRVRNELLAEAREPFDFGAIRRDLAADFQTDPGYEFRVNEAMDATRGQLSAVGLRNSGRALKELQERAAGIADQSFGDYMASAERAYFNDLSRNDAARFDYLDRADTNRNADLGRQIAVGTDFLNRENQNRIDQLNRSERIGENYLGRENTNRIDALNRQAAVGTDFLNRDNANRIDQLNRGERAQVDYLNRADQREANFLNRQDQNLTNYLNRADQQQANILNRRDSLNNNYLNLANQNFTNRQNLLSSLAGLGQTATANVADAGAKAATQMGNALIAGGQAKSSGILGQANAWQNALGGIGTSLGTLLGSLGGSSSTSPWDISNYTAGIRGGNGMLVGGV